MLSVQNRRHFYNLTNPALISQELRPDLRNCFSNQKLVSALKNFFDFFILDNDYTINVETSKKKQFLN